MFSSQQPPTPNTYLAPLAIQRRPPREALPLPLSFSLSLLIVTETAVRVGPSRTVCVYEYIQPGSEASLHKQLAMVAHAEERRGAWSDSHCTEQVSITGSLF